MGYVRERGEEEEISEDDNDDLLEGLNEVIEHEELENRIQTPEREQIKES